MEEIKTRFIAFVTEKLADAPDGAAKTDLIEELSENLYRRWLDMTAAGMGENDAWQAAAEALGDTAELVDYLKSLPPDEPLPKTTQARVKEMDAQIDSMMKNVDSIIRSVMNQTKNTLHDVKDQLRDTGVFHWSWKSDNGEPEVSVDTPEDSKPEDQGAGDDSHSHGFNLDKVTRKLDDAARKIKSALKEKAFSAGSDEADRTPEAAPTCPEALRGIVVQTVSGDVTIRMTEHPEDDVIVDGDVDDLDVRRSDDGVLTVTPGKTASSCFFFGRGLSSADVTLYLPRRRWDFLKISTVCGDVCVAGDQEVGLLAVKTTTGDLEGGLPRCGQLEFTSVSGDLEWAGDVQTLRTKTTSGDVRLKKL